MKFKSGTNDKFRRLGEHCSAPANHGGWASPPLGEPIRGFQTRRNAAEERPESRQRDAHGPAGGKGKGSRGCPADSCQPKGGALGNSRSFYPGASWEAFWGSWEAIEAPTLALGWLQGNQSKQIYNDLM